MDTLSIAKAEADRHSESAREILGLVAEFKVESDRDQEFAAGLLREVKSHLKAIEARRTAITVPLNQALREVNDLFRPAKDALAEGERVLKAAIADYLARRAAERRAALVEVAEARTLPEAERALERIGPATAPPAGVSVRQVQRFEVVDPDAVPREFCSPDPDKIKLALSAGVDVPGVRTFMEAVVASRSAS